MTHCGIDGFSRMVVYTKCSPNNRASTVYELFLSAIQQFGMPSRVRSDQGRENILVAQHMLEHRGDGRGSIITGCSTHNQRIERFWRDLHRCKTPSSSVIVLKYSPTTKTSAALYGTLGGDARMFLISLKLLMLCCRCSKTKSLYSSLALSISLVDVSKNERSCRKKLSHPQTTSDIFNIFQ